MTNITKPIIIVGTGRCGSTIFHRLLAKHPETMWLSGFCDRYPARPDLNRRAVTAMGNPLLRRLFGGRIQPGECYYFWDHYAYGFAEPCRDLVRTDVTARVKQQVRTAMGSMLTPARHRLLLKITGWPRLGYLNEIFEDARFIHLVRDGRAVAASLLHVDFWRGWFGPQGWRAGLLSPRTSPCGRPPTAPSSRWRGWSGASRCGPWKRRGAGWTRRAYGDPVRGLLRAAERDLPRSSGIHGAAKLTCTGRLPRGDADPKHQHPMA